VALTREEVGLADALLGRVAKLAAAAADKGVRLMIDAEHTYFQPVRLQYDVLMVLDKSLRMQLCRIPVWCSPGRHLPNMASRSLCFVICVVSAHLNLCWCDAGGCLSGD